VAGLVEEGLSWLPSPRQILLVHAFGTMPAWVVVGCIIRSVELAMGMTEALYEKLHEVGQAMSRLMSRKFGGGVMQWADSIFLPSPACMAVDEVSRPQ